ncbi:hypothetical protein D3C86_2068410 [compost metagenome]
MSDFRELAEQELDAYFQDGDVDWRLAFEGESLEVDLTVEGENRGINMLRFQDGTRQIAPPAPFDAVQCARSLKQAMKWKG